MKSYYGNYLGICVSNTDPEFRGRVKVFIPHIMPALYEHWNQEGKDIQIKAVGNNLQGTLDPSVIDTLVKILPWCEASTPILGTSTAGHYNAVTHNWAYTAADYNNKSVRPINCTTSSLDPSKSYVDDATNNAIGSSLASILNNTSRDAHAANPGQASCAGNVTAAIEQTFGISVQRPDSHAAKDYGPALVNAGFIAVPYTTGTNYPAGSVKISGAGSGHEYGHMETVTNPSQADSWQWCDKGSVSAWNSNSNDVVVYVPSDSLINKNFPNATVNNDAVKTGQGAQNCDQPATNANALSKAPDQSAQGVNSPTRPLSRPDGHPALVGSASEVDSGKPDTSTLPTTNGTSSINNGVAPVTQAINNGTVDPAFLGGVKSGMGLGDTAAYNATDAYNAAYQNVKSLGYSDDQANLVASAMTGNMAQESGFTTNLVHDNGQGYGLLGENQDNLLAETKWLASQGNTKAINALNEAGLTNSGTNLDEAGSRNLVSAINNAGGFTAAEQVNAMFHNPNFAGTAGGFASNSYNRRTGALPSLLQQTNIPAAASSMVGPGSYLVGTIATLNVPNRQNNAIAAASTFGGVDKAKLEQQAAAARQAAAAGNAAVAKAGTNIIHTPTDLGPTPIDTNGMPAGMFAVPNVGSLLWIFFQEGNPLFPVYFGASFSAREWQAAYKASSPPAHYPNAADGSTHYAQSSILRMNGAGAIISTDTYGDTVGDQRSINIISHTGAHHTLGAKGTVVYDPNAYYKQSDGHSFDAAMGNRETYTQGDSNTVTFGDQIIKIGNISQDAFDAVAEHQAILDEAHQHMQDL